MSAPDAVAAVARDDQELAFLMELVPVMDLHMRVTMTYLEWMYELGRPMTRHEALWFPAQNTRRDWLVDSLARMRKLGGCGALADRTEALIAALDKLDAALVAVAEGES